MKEQSSISKPKIHLPNKELVGLKKSEEQKEVTNEKAKLPKPTGWRMLVLPFRMDEKTKGGVLLGQETIERQQVASQCGNVLAMGPQCYMDKERYPNGPWCKVGDWVIFARYAGSRIQIEGGEIRLLNEDEILATVKNPDIIGGFNRLDTTIIKSCDGKVIAKEGADGLLGMAIVHDDYPEGLGVVIKVAHGWNPQATWYIARGILGVLGMELRNPYPLRRQKAFLVPGVVPEKHLEKLKIDALARVLGSLKITQNC